MQLCGRFVFRKGQGRRHKNLLLKRHLERDKIIIYINILLIWRKLSLGDLELCGKLTSLAMILECYGVFLDRLN